MRRYLRNARTRVSTFGPLYAVIAPLRRAAEITQLRAERRLLEIEGERGVLGPAHAAWQDHAPGVNKEHWGGWDWDRRGEEWNLSAAWKQGLIDDVLLATIPAGGTVLEIGPGAGRWTEVLFPRADRMIVVDLDERILARCREALGNPPGVVYLISPGSSLAQVADATVDAIWSFDAFVHIAPVQQAEYMAEIARVLTPGGVAAIHHADGRDQGFHASRRGWRAPMTATLFAALAREHGLVVDRVIRSWSGGRHDLAAYQDAISVLGKVA